MCGTAVAATQGGAVRVVIPGRLLLAATGAGMGKGGGRGGGGGFAACWRCAGVLVCGSGGGHAGRGDGELAAGTVGRHRGGCGGTGGGLGTLKRAAVWLDWRLLRPRRQSESVTDGPQAARSPTSVSSETRSTGNKRPAGGS
jgi:hypothetical protein